MVERLKQQLGPIFEGQPCIVAAYLFGSYAEGYVTTRSDIDLALVFGEDIPFREELRLAAMLDLALEVSAVDVVNLNRAPLSLRHRVLLQGVLLYERDPIKHATFIEDTIVRYLDFVPTLELFHREFDASVEEAYAL